MIFHRCSRCSEEFLMKRPFCPKCGSGEIAEVEVDEGKVVEEVHLIATPDPFPDEYTVVLFQTPGGAKGFCRTVDQVAPGDGVSIAVDEFGPVCSRKN